jgi:hypothetical protein
VGRKCNDWLKSFLEYSSFGEAPKRMYFWVGVSAVAGALRRRVWIDQAYFQWYPNLYVILVAPPGIVSKSTTADVGMSLLREVPGIKFGPSVVTWQALVKGFAEACESFQYKDGFVPMSPMTVVSSEFGNLLNPKDKDMVDMLVNLWDGKPFTKATKMSGTDEVINPWINLVACTTPEWIAGSFPEYMVGGGFTSRCLFVYADQKEKYVAYPALHVPKDLAQRGADLVHDLEHISVNICGEYHIEPDAIEWGTEWYHRHYHNDAKHLDPVRFGGYIARKQTQSHKVAMVLAASQRDDLVITRNDLETAVSMITDLEPDMGRVFEKIGMKEDAVQLDRLVQMVAKRGEVPYTEVYRWMQRYFPHKTDLEDVIATAVQAGYFYLDTQRTPPCLVARYGVNG